MKGINDIGAKNDENVFKNSILVPEGGREVYRAAERWRAEHGQSKDMVRQDTLCWMCEKACTKDCAWARSFDPVEGWVAIETVVAASNRLLQSYLVLDCPEFVPDDPRFTVAKPCKLCGRKPAIRHGRGNLVRVEHYTKCSWRRATVYKKTLDAAIAAWNKGEVRKEKEKKKMEDRNGKTSEN